MAVRSVAGLVAFAVDLAAAGAAVSATVTSATLVVTDFAFAALVVCFVYLVEVAFLVAIYILLIVHNMV